MEGRGEESLIRRQVQHSIKGQSCVGFYRIGYRDQIDLPNIFQGPQKIFQIDGVVGTGVSLSEAGQPVIEIYLKDKQAKAHARIPAALDNVPVRVKVTGQFEAF